MQLKSRSIQQPAEPNKKSALMALPRHQASGKNLPESGHMFVLFAVGAGHRLILRATVQVAYAHR